MDKQRFRSSILQIVHHEDKSEVDRYLDHLHKNLSECDKQFRMIYVALSLGILLHYLATSEPSVDLRIGSVVIPKSALFLDLYLLFLSGLFCTASAIGYLRRYIREAYDYIQIARYKAIGKVGFHELRLPPSYILGTQILMHDGGKIERVLGYLTGILHIAVFVGIPCGYLVHTIISQLKLRAHSIIDVLILSLSLLFIIVGLATMFLSKQLDFPEMEGDAGETKG
jgi:hypothetical protein